MKATVIENIKGSELPASWLKKAKGKTDQNFTIILKPGKGTISKENFLKSMREISAEAKTRGLTPETLDQILNEN